MAKYLILIEHLQHFPESMFCFDFTVGNAEKGASHKYVVQNARSTFRAIVEVSGKSVLNPTQHSFNELKSSTQTAIILLIIFKYIGHSPINYTLMFPFPPPPFQRGPSSVRLSVFTVES